MDDDDDDTNIMCRKSRQNSEFIHYASLLQPYISAFDVLYSRLIEFMISVWVYKTWMPFYNISICSATHTYTHTHAHTKQSGWGISSRSDEQIKWSLLDRLATDCAQDGIVWRAHRDAVHLYSCRQIHRHIHIILYYIICYMICEHVGECECECVRIIVRVWAYINCMLFI